MILLLAGNDILARHKACEKFLKSLSGGVEVLNLARGEWNPPQIESLYSGAGLFSKTSAVIFSNILDTLEAREYLFPRLDKLQASDNYFVFLEGKLPKLMLDNFKKARAQIEVYEKREIKEEKFNNFLLANALGAKNKLDLWIYFRQAIGAGVSLEELTGVLFWKAKDMILKSDFRKFSEEELKNISAKLSYLLPEARREGRDAEAALEEFLLLAI